MGKRDDQALADRRTADNIPYKTRWALEDVIAESMAAQREISQLGLEARKRSDPLLLAALLQLALALGRIQRIALDARQGRYDRGSRDGD